MFCNATPRAGIWPFVSIPFFIVRNDTYSADPRGFYPLENIILGSLYSFETVDVNQGNSRVWNCRYSFPFTMMTEIAYACSNYIHGVIAKEESFRCSHKRSIFKWAFSITSTRYVLNFLNFLFCVDGIFWIFFLHKVLFFTSKKLHGYLCRCTDFRTQDWPGFRGVFRLFTSLFIVFSPATYCLCNIYLQFLYSLTIAVIFVPSF